MSFENKCPSTLLCEEKLHLCMCITTTMSSYILQHCIALSAISEYQLCSRSGTSSDWCLLLSAQGTPAMTFEYQGAEPVVTDVCFEVPRNSSYDLWSTRCRWQGLIRWIGAGMSPLQTNCIRNPDYLVILPLCMPPCAKLCSRWSSSCTCTAHKRG